MQQEKIVYGVIGGIVGGLLVWLAVSNAVTTNNRGMMQMMGLRQAAQDPMGNTETMDQHFIEQMIPHHEDAITMAKLAQTRAQTAEVKQLAEDIIISQGKEIEQMKAWYKDWFSRDLPTDEQVMVQHGMMGSAKPNSMHMGMMGDETDISRLENASDFDRAFVEEMIPHHQMAVMMASMLKQGTNRAEMRQLADDIITAQTNEIDQMRAWLKAWGN